MTHVLRPVWLAWALCAALWFLCGIPCGVAATPVAEGSAGYQPGPMLQRFLDGPMGGVEEIVFAVRVPGRDHWYVTFGNYACNYGQPADLAFKKTDDGVLWGYGEGGRLCRMNLRTGEVKVLLDDPLGGVRDPQLHYDGQKILFSYRKGGEHVFHLCEIQIDGTGLRQLTDGPDDDIEPAYCPDGSIIFCSSRCRRFVNCWFTRVATLHQCDGDGGNVRMLSCNNDHDNTPWLLPDGRVLYMRWEYVDRSQVHYHHLWTANPDGTNQTVFYGNQHGGVAMLDAKPIPNSDKIVAAFSPGHGSPEHLGYVTVVDPKHGPDMLEAARNVSKEARWKDPWAFSEDCFLVANPKGIYVMDGAGKAERIYQLPEGEQARLQCHEPRPLAARPREKVIPPRTDLHRATGRMVLADIYHGRNLEGVQRGEIKKLLVLKQLPKPVNFSGGMEPLTIGGSFTLAGIVGTVPVEEDGSAYMELPALQSLFFVALDADGVAVKRMHSFTVLQPGETTGCVGCHEQRTGAPLSKPVDLLAMRRPASKVEPVPGVPEVIDYSRDIQPVLDRHCVECHSPDRYEGRVDLTGDHTMMYTVSYWTMRLRGLVTDGRNEPKSNRAPRTFGSGASPLMKYLDGSHYGAALDAPERLLVRMWLDTSATYPGTYAALGCGTYPVHLPFGPMRERCGGCHGRDVEDQHGKRFAFFFPGAAGERWEPMANLTRPEKARVLRAPLAKEAGGLALCKEAVFRDTSDPLYGQMLAALQDAQRRLAEGKRFDISGFRPNGDYIREMQRFGFLPRDLKPEDPIDVYAVDRAYWNAFLWQGR